jgi:hypothetical protein
MVYGQAHCDDGSEHRRAGKVLLRAASDRMNTTKMIFRISPS